MYINATLVFVMVPATRSSILRSLGDDPSGIAIDLNSSEISAERLLMLLLSTMLSIYTLAYF